MSWKDAIRKQEPDRMAVELNGLVGKEGDLDDIMKMIDKKFGVKSKIIYDSSSRPVLGFDLAINVDCRMGTKDNPSTTEKFTVIDIETNRKIRSGY